MQSLFALSDLIQSLTRSQVFGTHYSVLPSLDIANRLFKAWEANDISIKFTKLTQAINKPQIRQAFNRLAKHNSTFVVKYQSARQERKQYSMIGNNDYKLRANSGKKESRQSLF